MIKRIPIVYFTASGFVALSSGCGAKESHLISSTFVTEADGIYTEPVTSEISDEDWVGLTKQLFPKNKDPLNQSKQILTWNGNRFVRSEEKKLKNKAHSFQLKTIELDEGPITVTEFSFNEDFFKTKTEIINKMINKNELFISEEGKYYTTKNSDLFKLLTEMEIIELQEGDRSVICGG